MVRVTGFPVCLLILAAYNSVLGFQVRTNRVPVASSVRFERSHRLGSILPPSQLQLQTLRMSSSSSSSGSSGTHKAITNKHDKHDKTLDQPQGVFNIVGVSSKFFVSGVATLVLYSTNSWVPLYYILGAVLNGFVSKCIKNIVKQPRPPQSDKDGYGMPSSHTQSFFFFLTAVAFNAKRFLNTRNSTILSLSILLYSLVASYWRVVAGVHSLSQTLVGAVVGVIFGTIVAKNEVATIGFFKSLFQRLTGSLTGSPGVPLYAKLIISTLGAIVICKSELKILLKFMRNILKKKRIDYTI